MRSTGGSVSSPTSRSLVWCSHKLWMALQAGPCSEILPESGLKKQCPVFPPLQGFGSQLQLCSKKTCAGHRDGRAGVCCPVKLKSTFIPFQGWVPKGTGIITVAFSIQILKVEASLSFPSGAFCQMTPIWSHNPNSFFKNQENPNVTWCWEVVRNFRDWKSPLFIN